MVQQNSAYTGVHMPRGSQRRENDPSKPNLHTLIKSPVASGRSDVIVDRLQAQFDVMDYDIDTYIVNPVDTTNQPMRRK